MPLCIQKLVEVKSGSGQSKIEMTTLSLGFFNTHWKSSIRMMQFYRAIHCIYRHGGLKLWFGVLSLWFVIMSRKHK